MRVNEVARLVAGHRPPLGAYDVDIIILSLNRLPETLEATQSALAQRGVTFHVTVLDQGSEPEIVRDLTRTFSKAANFSLYTSEKNLGVARGRNLAASFGHAQIIIALDNDAIFSDKWVAANAVRAFTREPDLGALGFNILSADGVHPDKFSWGYPTPLITRFKERFDTTTFVGAGHAIRRVTWNAAGGYDPAFFFTWEEYDFCLAAIALNWRICYDGSLAVIHKISPNARIGWDEARMTHFVRNRLIISRNGAHPGLC
jgi:GT2 family glycosyltransferase